MVNNDYTDPFSNFTFVEKTVKEIFEVGLTLENLFGVMLYPNKQANKQTNKSTHIHIFL